MEWSKLHHYTLFKTAQKYNFYWASMPITCGLYGYKFFPPKLNQDFIWSSLDLPDPFNFLNYLAYNHIFYMISLIRMYRYIIPFRVMVRKKEAYMYRWNHCAPINVYYHNILGSKVGHSQCIRTKNTEKVDRNWILYSLSWTLFFLLDRTLR